jgi:quercetin dioxygenase-like cupin family protein
VALDSSVLISSFVPPGGTAVGVSTSESNEYVAPPALAGQEDGTMTTTAQSDVFIDNERVRVTEWRFAPGATTGWHRHEMDYVVVPMLDGVLELVGPGGDRTRAELRKGVPYFRNAGVEHDVINANSYEFAFVEIELK